MHQVHVASSPPERADRRFALGSGTLLLNLRALRLQTKAPSSAAIHAKPHHVSVSCRHFASLGSYEVWGLSLHLVLMLRLFGA